MTSTYVLTALAGLAALASAEPDYLSLSDKAPVNAGLPLEAFMSYSIEFSGFVAYAGNSSHPGTYSNNLLDNLGKLQGTKPYIRVGGNSADQALFKKDQKEAWHWIIDPKDPKHPKNESFGPSYFESYQTWPNTRFIHGFNLLKSSDEARQALLESVPHACKALGNGKLLDWQLGNEPDLYSKEVDGKRQKLLDNDSYRELWQKWAGEIQTEMKKTCPDMADDKHYKFYAPSFAGYNELILKDVFDKGFNKDGWVEYIDQHNYINSNTNPRVTLQNTLMNHTVTASSVHRLLERKDSLAALPADRKANLPFVLGEHNSLIGGGRPGLSSSFGAALWGLDFNLLCASNNISRVHMHQNNGAAYQSWQPLDTETTTAGTRPPYYGNIAVASFLGDVSSPDKAARISNIPMEDDTSAAYAAFNGGKLNRLMLINMIAFNATDDNPSKSKGDRPIQHYGFQLPQGVYKMYTLERLLAAGSDAVTGITFDGYSYNHDLDNGKPVLLKNVTRGETGDVTSDGRIYISVPRSSAVIVRLE
ncbi:hypothetical protein AMS68_006893 [Peltaster fructicola]|uniref:Beta-glucuronidase C-terminal domain-containing protein n=1 Tax=Peltaster fructicola TaxID=286661 RepID=A0A6H0Y346_9PEZI|nr:hypothetical protein AMS68_006893 [Peltaster fructicola]